MTLHRSPHPIFDRARDKAHELLSRGIVDRIWDRDPGVWSTDGATRKAIANRLGWLTAPSDMRPQLVHARQLAEGLRREGFREAYLLGMGGSSLCAEVLRQIEGVAEGHLQLHVVDTTDAETIRRHAARLDPRRSVFLVASKSGTTIEVASLEEYYASRMRSGPAGDGWAAHFVAITDPETTLARRARERGYRAVFLNPPDIGGRFSALSLFGLVPAALVGASLDDLVDAGETMAEGCRQSNLANPGLELGCLVAEAAAAGRDKLTLCLPPALGSLGLWIEQLIAESTGKQGRGILPVVDERLGQPDDYGDDRLFVSLETEDATLDPAALDALESAGHPVARLSMRHSALGSEFFRWEFAVAVAGAALDVNPFDEPNVQEAKDRTGELLAHHRAHGSWPDESPTAADRHVQAFGSPRFDGTTPAAVIRSALGSLGPGDYVALLSYISPTVELTKALDEIRADIRRRARVATTLGVGPRYLHSTGQYHKGGPNRALCLLLTSDEREETPVPSAPYSFEVLKRAQALGDLAALRAHDRRVVRIHLHEPDAPDVALLEVFKAALR